MCISPVPYLNWNCQTGEIGSQRWGHQSTHFSILGSHHTDLVKLADIRALGNIAGHEGKLLNKVVNSLLEISKSNSSVSVKLDVLCINNF